MTAATDLRGLPFRHFGLVLGIAEAATGDRLARALVVGPGSDRHGDDTLDYDLAAADLGDVRAGRAPLLVEHRSSLDYTIGSVADAWLEDGALHCLLRFARGGEADWPWALLEQGFPVNVSLGAEVRASEPTGPSPAGGTAWRVTAWRLSEVSVVARGQCREARAELLRREDLQQLAARLPPANEAARLELGRRLQLDRWNQWSIGAGVRLAHELGVDAAQLGDALSREVATHGEALARDMAVPILPAAEDLGERPAGEADDRARAA